MAALAVGNTPVFAAINCTTQYGAQYGAGQICVKTGEIKINKEVFNPTNKKFEDNLVLTSNVRFAPGDEVKFKITVTNVGDNTLGVVDVKDTLPAFLEPVSGDFTFQVKDLEVGKSSEREITARVLPINRLPKETAVICDDRTTNAAEAVANGQTDKDTAQVCIEKKAVTELPKAGAEDTVFVVLGSLLAGFVGIKLSKVKSARKLA